MGERLMEILDEATAEVEGTSDRFPGRDHPCVRVVRCINTLMANNIFEVLLALPFSYAIHLVQFLNQFFKGLSGGAAGDAGSTQLSSVFNAAATVETPCQAALIITYVHHRELAVTATARPLLMELRLQMRELLQAEKDRIGLSMAGLANLQRSLKRSASLLSTAGASESVGVRSGGQKPKKR